MSAGRKGTHNNNQGFLAEQMDYGHIFKKTEVNPGELFLCNMIKWYDWEKDPHMHGWLKHWRKMSKYT